MLGNTTIAPLILAHALPVCRLSRGADVRAEFARWASAYRNCDLEETMRIFARQVRFQFEGSPDLGFEQLRATYSIACGGRSGVSWRPRWEGVIVSGDMAAAFSTWTAVKVDEGGAPQVIRTNRSVDILRRNRRCGWKIVRSLSYPEASPGSPGGSTAGAGGR